METSSVDNITADYVTLCIPITTLQWWSLASACDIISRNLSTAGVLILFICFGYKGRNNNWNSETNTLFSQGSKIPSKWYLMLLLYNQFEDYNEISMLIDNSITF